MNAKPLPSVEYLRECFDYDPETGVLRWKVRPREHFAAGKTWRQTNARSAGVVAGYIGREGYCRVRLGGGASMAHRVVWKLMTGADPADKVDHINGNRSDNRLCNLREADDGINQKNAARRKDNTSGVTGVRLRGRKWHVRIKHTAREWWVGVFATKEEAVAARKTAERELGFHPNHGRAA